MSVADAASDRELRQRELVTPEGVDLRLVLASASERAAAFFIDVVVIIGGLVSATLLLIGMTLLIPFNAGEFMTAIWILAFFFLRNFYFMAFEMTPRAATLGKRALGLRVTTRDGSPLTANAIFARNATRELEIFLPLTFVAAQASAIDAWITVAAVVWSGILVFFPLFNRDRLRIGDIVGGTWVVRAPRRILDVDLTANEAGAGLVFSLKQLDAYGIKELSVLEDVLRRRDPATMKAVAERIRAKISSDDKLPDEEFLSAYYKGLRGRLEARLLFGRRRRDKFDLG
jgi:uncharacterized RDD family membrane protein YckC